MAQIQANYVNIISVSETGILSTKGIQNMPPKNTLLWHIDYFEFKLFEKQQIQEKYSDLPSFS